MDLHPRPLHDDTDLDATTPTGVPGFGRRHALKLMAAGAGLLTLAACGQSSSDDPAASGSTATSTTTAGSTTSTASSTASSAASSSSASSGGSARRPSPRRPAAPTRATAPTARTSSTESGVVRSDIRTSFGSASRHRRGRAADHQADRHRRRRRPRRCAGAAVYLWHCDREGRYSMYSNGVTDENYLRGVQEADADGKVTFTSIFPAAYSGRWPHIHFEVYPSVDAATGGEQAIATSQLALPEDVCDARLRHRAATARASATWPRRRSTTRQRLQRRRRPAAGHGHGERGGGVHRHPHHGRVTPGGVGRSRATPVG